MDRKTIDTAHGRDIPTGRPIAAAMRTILQRQAAEVFARLRVQAPVQVPSLQHWTQPMAKALAPLMQPYFVQGGLEAADRVQRLVNARWREQVDGDTASASDRGWRGPEGRGKAPLRSGAAGRAGHQGHRLGAGRLAHHGHHGRFAGHRKARTANGPPAIAFDVTNPRVAESIDRLTFDFCDETNRTSMLRLDQALVQLHLELGQGVREGEVYARLTQRVLGIFNDPYRAARIGQTEASRAVHGGQLLLAQEAQEEHDLKLRKRWLASSDACDACLKLDGKEVELEADFTVVSGAGPYRHVKHAPLHPHCMCSMTEVLA